MGAEPYEKMEHGTKAVCGRAGGAGGADGKDKGPTCWTQALEEDKTYDLCNNMVCVGNSSGSTVDQTWWAACGSDSAFNVKAYIPLTKLPLAQRTISYQSGTTHTVQIPTLAALYDVMADLAQAHNSWIS